eukprot:CAMPEP_0185594416 /NCGR_PEP_ID=MMETSP0434-20130131/74816_1 /TAXON_ID=626734 ORGANISM="Favella taraikaensis, Strain Fe Narragansett Bay" /NCGR_SAMPLE_ID=MMETSP0434 /ASSEMBLY_ACC=CAM_ASM_000379 /LENGTH=136 /DNA_ID=CAMNT_0028221731 /DNA_START=173 /DNA_END=585 /DNA_ORIENTATION=+
MNPPLIAPGIDEHAEAEHACACARAPEAVNYARDRRCSFLAALLFAEVGAASNVHDVINAAEEEPEEGHGDDKAGLAHCVEPKSEDERDHAGESDRHHSDGRPLPVCQICQRPQDHGARKCRDFIHRQQVRNLMIL